MLLIHDLAMFSNPTNGEFICWAIIFFQIEKAITIMWFFSFLFLTFRNTPNTVLGTWGALETFSQVSDVIIIKLACFVPDFSLEGKEMKYCQYIWGNYLQTFTSSMP